MLTVYHAVVGFHACHATVRGPQRGTYACVTSKKVVSAS